MAGVLRQAGHRSIFWQLCEALSPLPSREAFIARLKDEAPDLVAFSVVTNQWEYARSLAEWAREALDVPLVCGGIHALFGVEQILSTGLFDFVFRGECDEAFLEFVQKLNRQESLEKTANLAFRRDGNIIVNPVRPFPSLDRLPSKDYEIMDFQRLIEAKNGWVGLMTSRGCPFSCTYCFNHQMVSAYRKDLGCQTAHLNYIRQFPVDTVMKEIQFLLDRYDGITMFILDDDLFTFDKDYVKAFCQSYAKHCSVPFVVNAHVGFFDEEVADILASAHCKIVKFGVESGSPDIRSRILNRRMTDQQIIDAIQIVNEFGMHSSAFVMIGLPSETEEDIYATIDLLARARPGRFRWTYFFPFPGTRAYDLSVQQGSIDQQKMQRLVNFTDETCLDFGPEQNLLLSKIGRFMPWFVNARSDLAVADFYQERVEEILHMDLDEWTRFASALKEKDQAFSQRFQKEGLSHYAIKYNRFTGVISDYFLNESPPDHRGGTPLPARRRAQSPGLH